MESKIKKNFIHKIIEKFILKHPGKKICTRFPPEPNGYLHIGHAKSIFINFNLAKQYNGTCNLRFDDTNPNKEKLKYIQEIVKDIKWLGFKLDNNIKYSSEYFDFLYQCAIKLIKKNLAYVDQLNQNDLKKYRGSLKSVGKNSPYRNQSIKKNLFLFEKMKSGQCLEGSMCLRAKIDMKSPCITMRDPVLYRIILKKHHQTKHRWCIYPMYDFAHCIADALEGITHSLCTLEFQDNRKLYEWILQKLNLFNNIPKQYEFSRLNLEHTILSKRKLKILIKLKIIDGWSDPRIFTLSGLRNRGYTPKSILKFCEKVGVTKQNSIIQLSLLEKCIRDDLDYESPRKMAILDPIKIIINNFLEKKPKILCVPNHPKNINLGNRKLLFSKEIYIDKEDCNDHNKKNYNGLILGNKVRLKYAYTIKAIKIIKDKNKKIICIICKYYPETFGKTPKKIKIIQWVSKNNAMPAIFYIFQPLFFIKNPEILENFIQYINKKSKIIKTGLIENSILSKENNHAYQFERIGYFFQNPKYQNKKPFIFHEIVSLKKNKTI